MKKLFITTFLLCFFLITPTQASIVSESQPTQGSTDRGILTGVNNMCLDKGDCTICDVLTVVNNIILGVLGVIGSIALAVFAYAGFKIMISQGHGLEESSEMEKNALIGLVLIFASVAIVNFILNIIISGGLTIDLKQPAKIIGNNWLEICGEVN